MSVERTSGFFESAGCVGRGEAGDEAEQVSLTSHLRRQVVGRTLGGVLLAIAAFGGGLITVGCGDSFSEDCTTTRSCPPPDQGEAAGATATSAGGSAGGAGSSASGAGSSAGVDAEPGGAPAGGQPDDESSDTCEANADCSNADAEDGEELCVGGVCRAGNAPPRVVSITPEAGSDDVERDATITVVFSEPLDPDTVSAGTVQLFDGDSALTGTLKLSSDRDEVSFTPDMPLALWGAYRLEVSRAIKDAAGVALLEDESSSFQVRDGAWSVTTLADAEAIELPSSLPVSASGALLTTWLDGPSSDCGAKGAWYLEGISNPLEAFEASRGSGCARVSASIAPDGSAIASWGQSNIVRTQSFSKGSWDASERQAPGYSGVAFIGAQAFAHDQQHITINLDVNAKGQPIRQFLGGPARGDWTGVNQFYVTQLGSRAQAAFAADGAGLATWTYTDGVYAVAYDVKAASWDAEATVLPGTESSGAERGVTGVATAPAGDAMVLWVEGPADNQVLKASRFAPKAGWSSAPVNVSNSLGGEPLFDAPGLVFDGETFVAAWTAATGGKLTAYTARYDLATEKWSSREPHVTELGESSMLMPRLGVDAHRNLMLVWAVGAESLTLVYQRYRAETQAWGDVEAIADGTFTDAAFVADGKLAFGFAGNGLGGLMFRTEHAGSQRLRLASFF
jgi:hypothetical protein